MDGGPAAGRAKVVAVRGTASANDTHPAGTAAEPAALTAFGDVIRLQRAAGNAAVTGLLNARHRGASITVMRQDTEVADAGASDAGESLPGGVPPTAQERDAERLRALTPGGIEDHDLGPALDIAMQDGNQPRAQAIVVELRSRGTDDSGFGFGMPPAIPRGEGGSALVTPEVALAMIENMIAGRPAFRPELGVGGASWFVTEGNPHTGVSAGNTVPLQVDLVSSNGGAVYRQADLDRIFLEEEGRARPEVEVQVRERFRIRTGRPAPPQLSNALADKVAHQLRRLAERRMWERIGREVAASPARVGEVILPPGGRFSAQPGRFKIITDAARIRIRGGPMSIVAAIRASGGTSPVPALERSAVELGRSMRIAGHVRTVFRVGGRILIVFAVAHDIYRIVVAEDRPEAVITTVGGWAGAAAGAAAFSALWTPADVAGPWAWAAHGVGVLVSGAVGYWVGAESTRYVYRLIVQSDGNVGVP